jgi:hypothetical protein
MAELLKKLHRQCGLFLSNTLSEFHGLARGYLFFLKRKEALFMKPRVIIFFLFILLLVGTGATTATAGEHTAVSRAGKSWVYVFDIAATDTHGTGKLTINVKKHTFVFKGKGFSPDRRYILYHRIPDSWHVHAFASAVSTRSGKLYVKGKWEGDASGLQASKDFGLLVGGTTPTPMPPFSNIAKVIDNKNNLIKTGTDIMAGKLTTGGFSGTGAVFALANMAVSTYRYNNIMDELNSMDAKVDELLTDMAAVQNQLANIENMILNLSDWIKKEVALGVHLMDAESWIELYYSNPSKTGGSYNWACWQLADCPDVNTIECVNSACVGGDTPGSACTNNSDCYSCTSAVTDKNVQLFNSNYYTAINADPPKDPPDLATENFYLWWAYSVNQKGDLPPFMVNGNTAEVIVQQIHDGMVPKQATDTNGLLAFMQNVFTESGCKNDVTACNLYEEVYGPLESYFQQVITSQITLVQAIVESYAELASFYQTNHPSNPHTWDSAVSNYMTSFQQMLSQEAESFVEVAEQIALYRAADGRFDWSSFSKSDAAQVLARADFLAARLVGSATGKPWAWPPGVTGRIFYTEQQTVPSATVHNACKDTTCTTLTEAAPMPQDLACKTNSNYPGQCLLTGDWPYLQWSAPDSNNVVTGTPTFTWKLRRLTQQQMAKGTYQIASVNAQYGNVNLDVSEYGNDYSNPPAADTTPVLFGSFNNVEGNLGIGALGANRTYSGGGDDKVHDFTITPSTTYTQITVAYKDANSTGPALSGNWYEKMRIKVPDNQLVFGSFPMIRVFWPATIEISLGSYRAGNCCDDYYYQKVEQSLRLLESDGDYTSAGQPFAHCTTGNFGFGSCSYSTQDRNDSKTMLASSSVTLNHSMTYTLQARFSDEIIYYYGAPSCYCQPYPTSGSHVTWTVFNPTVVLVKD